MLRQRIIFTLIYSDGFFMQSRNFRLQKVGNLSWLEKNYKFQNIAFALDELIVLDACKGQKDKIKFAATVANLVNDVFIPIAAGGGINSIADAELFFNNGADKVVINSALFFNPKIVKEIVSVFGSQSVVASIDCKKENNEYSIFVNNGTMKIDFNLNDYIKYLEEIGVGEIYLNSIDKDGTGFGYDDELVKIVSGKTTLPLIIAGGAGNEEHLLKGLKNENVSAVATANLFNFIGDGLPIARNKLIGEGMNLPTWKY